MKRRALAAFALVLGALPLGQAACVPETTITDAICPPYEDFKKVSPVLEQRCGTLDCHGQVSRPLRLYSNLGLRLPGIDEPENGYFPGGTVPTVEQEIEANYRAVCGLEPEIITDVVNGAAEPTELTLVRKPRLSEKHKGGRIWDEGKAGDRCLVAWLKAEYAPGTFNDGDCKAALGVDSEQ